MPSFDIVSEIDLQEVRNSVENALREVTNRFDFRGVHAEIELNDKNKTIKITSESDFQVRQLIDILKDKLLKRGIENGALEFPDDTTHSGKTFSIEATLKQGIDTPIAKQIVKLIKESKLKVQTQIQGEQVRVTGKARDDLQATIALMKKSELDQPFQYINFRD